MRTPALRRPALAPRTGGELLLLLLLRPVRRRSVSRLREDSEEEAGSGCHAFSPAWLLLALLAIVPLLPLLLLRSTTSLGARRPPAPCRGLP